MIALLLAVAAAAQAPAWPVTTPGFRPCEEYPVSRFELPQYQRCRAAAADLERRATSRMTELAAHPAQAGCLGKDEVTCVATLSRAVAMTSFSANEIGVVPDIRDINGEPVRHTVLLAALLPTADPSKPARAGIHLTVDGSRVTGVYVGLPENPVLARTEADWDRTQIYQLTQAVLGSACVPEQRLAFYRHIDSGISGAAPTHGYQGGPDPTISHDRSSTERRCGVDFNFGSTGGESASQGAFGGGTLMFTVPGAI